MPDVHEVLATRLFAIAPGIEAIVQATTTRHLPLGLGWQAFAEEAAVGVGVIPAYMNNGMSQPRVDARL